jgi:hypothetical protein
MFTPKVMAFIGYALLALVIYQVADRYIISPEWYERADAEANELRARRNAEAYASDARAAGATYLETQRQARIGYNASRALDSSAPVAATPPPRAITPPDLTQISPNSEDNREIEVSSLCDQPSGLLGLPDCSPRSPAALDRSNKRWINAHHYVSQGYECKYGRGAKHTPWKWSCYRTDGRKWAGEL